jgi:hypothetical protein
MPWRIIAHGGHVWHVDAIAERRANAESWQLALAFRAAEERSRRPAFWTLYPLEAASRSSLLIQADRIPDEALSRVLAERVA